jgi:hypothetical protein
LNEDSCIEQVTANRLDALQDASPLIQRRKLPLLQYPPWGQGAVFQLNCGRKSCRIVQLRPQKMELEITMDRTDWLLSALANASNTGLSPVQMQKVLFVLGKECPQEVGESYYQFRNYHYGPFSSLIYSDAERLACEGLIAISGDGSSRAYTVTPAGTLRADSFVREAPLRATEFVKALVQWAQKLSFSEIVTAVYAKYPGTDENSIFRRAAR